MLWSFITACILIELTPGPNMTWLAVLGANKGRLSALAAVAGIGLGLLIAAILAGLGLTALFSQYPQSYDVLRWAGTLYLFYLAFDAWRDSDTTETDRDGNAFVQGLITNILNPKAYMFYVVMLPQFIDAARDQTEQLVLLSLIYVAIATGIHAGIAIAAGSIAGWLKTSPSAVIVRKTLALAIALAAVWFFYSTRIVT